MPLTLALGIDALSRAPPNVHLLLSLQLSREPHHDAINKTNFLTANLSFHLKSFSFPLLQMYQWGYVSSHRK